MNATVTLAPVLLLMSATLCAAPAVGAETPEASTSRIFELPASIGAGDAKEVSVLVDESFLKLVVITLRGGTELPLHSAPVPTTIQVASGEGVIHIAGEAVPVSGGTIVALAAGEDHDVAPAPGSDMLLLVHYLRSAGSAATALSEGHDH